MRGENFDSGGSASDSDVALEIRLGFKDKIIWSNDPMVQFMKEVEAHQARSLSTLVNYNSAYESVLVFTLQLTYSSQLLNSSSRIRYIPLSFSFPSLAYTKVITSSSDPNSHCESNPSSTISFSSISAFSSKV
jgi:hypothetical protein